MARKNVPTVAIVNPKDPKDSKPRIANQEDVQKNGWTLWADRHDPARAEDIRKADVKKEADKDASDEQVSKETSVDPKDVKKAPQKKS